MTIARKMPQFDLETSVVYNKPRDETTFGISVSPRGAGGRRFGGILNPAE